MQLIQVLRTAVREKTIHWISKFLCFCALFNLPSVLCAGQYFQNFFDYTPGATNFSDGSTLSSTAPGTVACLTNLDYNPVTGSPYSELQLTESGTNDIQSAFELPDLDSGAPVYAFSVKWNSDIKGSFPGFGEGFSFNFGPLSSVNLTTNNAEETGYGVGLCLSVQTDAGTNSGFHLLANGTIIASLTNKPSIEWGTTNNSRHFWEVDWNYYSGMSVHLDGQAIITNVLTTGFLPEGGDVFAWAARCDTNTEEVRLDNIVAVTGGNLVQLPTSGPYFAYDGLGGYDGNSVTNAFDGTNSTYYDAKGSPWTVGATVSPPNPVLVYALTSGESAGDTPRQWDLFGSTNGGVLWTECSYGGGYFVNAAETRAWLVTNSIPDYGAYELFYTGGFNSLTSIGELRFYALSAVGAPYVGWMQQANLASSSIASSSDGTRLAAAAYDIYTSTNSGRSWTPAANTSGQEWGFIASSSDGNELAAVGNDGEISTNIDLNFDGFGYGVFFYDSSAPQENWGCIASSSNGVNLAAGVGFGGGIYISTDSGYSWTQTAAPSTEWFSLAYSADGSNLIAGVNGRGIYISRDFGTTWTLTTAPNGSWHSIASSSDGAMLAAAAESLSPVSQFGAIYVSTNSGSTWTMAPGTSGERWSAIACSSNGKKLAAAQSVGSVYFSTNSGSTWITNSGAPRCDWAAIALSADGTKLEAAAQEEEGVTNWGIYTYGFVTPQLSPSLRATLSGGYPVLSWATTNGGNFVLQATTNLVSTNWLNVSWPVTVNTNSSGPNYQVYQVTDLPTDGQKFYRLVGQ